MADRLWSIDQIVAGIFEPLAAVAVVRPPNPPAPLPTIGLLIKQFAEGLGGAVVEGFRSFLVQTAKVGSTMARQGPDVAIGRLHPEFAKRLAAAIEEARRSGLFHAAIFSAYRPPAFRIGGFRDKFNSLHAYGLAVDMSGVGRPGSAEARLWHKIAAKHGIFGPYGPNHRVEWNHMQHVPIKSVRRESPLRKTITAGGPVNLERMWRVADAMIGTGKK